jgi:hypothetical protein
VIADENISGLATRFSELPYLAMPPVMTHLARVVVRANPEMNLLLYSADCNLEIVGTIQKCEWEHDEFMNLFRETGHRVAVRPA